MLVDTIVYNKISDEIVTIMYITDDAYEVKNACGSLSTVSESDLLVIELGITKERFLELMVTSTEVYTYSELSMDTLSMLRNNTLAFVGNMWITNFQVQLETLTEYYEIAKYLFENQVEE